jgi:hypothetical protein
MDSNDFVKDTNRALAKAHILLLAVTLLAGIGIGAALILLNPPVDWVINPEIEALSPEEK